MPEPFVTVLIDTYNYGHFVGQAIDSALSQDYPADRMEILVVDDGSTDDTADRVRVYGDKIRYFQRQNGGQGSALNVGFANCSGDIICLLDADDYWQPDKLRQVVAAFEREPVGMVSNDFQLSNPDAGEGVATGIDLVSGDIPKSLDLLLRHRVFPTSCLAFRRTALQKLMPIPEAIRLQADCYLALLAIFVAPSRALADKLTVYRIHGENLYSCANGAKDSSGMERSRSQMLKLIIGEMREWLVRNGFDMRERNIRAFLDQWAIFQEAAAFKVDAPGRWKYFSHLLRYNRTYRRRQNWKLTVLNYVAAGRALVWGPKRPQSEMHPVRAEASGPSA